jgi:hypothetical protein
VEGEGDEVEVGDEAEELLTPQMSVSETRPTIHLYSRLPLKSGGGTSDAIAANENPT